MAFSCRRTKNDRRGRGRGHSGHAPRTRRPHCAVRSLRGPTANRQRPSRRAGRHQIIWYYWQHRTSLATLALAGWAAGAACLRPVTAPPPCHPAAPPPTATARLPHCLSPPVTAARRGADATPPATPPAPPRCIFVTHRGGDFPYSWPAGS